MLKIAFSGKNKTLRARWTGIRTTVNELARTRVDPDRPLQEDDIASAKTDIETMLEEQQLSALRANAMPPPLFLRLFLALRALGFRTKAPNALD
jgi:hypothetical protein